MEVSPTKSTITEPGKATVTVRNSDNAKFGIKQERHTLLKVYADRRGPRKSEKLVVERIQSHIKEQSRNPDSPRELIISFPNASKSALQQVPPSTSDSPAHDKRFLFDTVEAHHTMASRTLLRPDSEIAAPTKKAMYSK